ncbi:hypothetical protein Rhe02_17250 [Rhizocola hellebori]|uniref:Peptidase M28 domain-containing protein n=1 Tax=Rhizocola hellebori TaxID=1392758 RepID=A0A8J3VF81_9ACTN|nr:M28 family peptidase [Rhizocola hellebori]GIH03658.1 hypothetical protein Rhe02_17250 [Rhizocola hellebori]
MSLPIAGPETTGPAHRMREMVVRLAADEFAGRRVGSAGGRAAARWLAEQLRSVGAQVRLDEFTVTGAVKELSAPPVLIWHQEFGDTDLVHRRDFAEHLASAHLPTVRKGQLTLAGSGKERGAWVVAETLGTASLPHLFAAGAAGLLVPRGADDAGWMPKMIAGPAAGPLPVLSVRTDLHTQLAASAEGSGSWVSASVPVKSVEVNGINVHGVFREPEPGALSVLLAAHFDGVGDDAGLRHPAAADNASGVAVIVEAAQQLHHTLPPGMGLAVALLDAEEAGAHGSAHHAPQVPAGTLVINMDGAAQLHQAAAVEAGGPAHALLAALDQAGRLAGVPLRAQAMPSDNRRYAAAGLAAVGIGMGMPGYQTPAETADRVEDSTLLAAAALITTTVTILREHVKV